MLQPEEGRDVKELPIIKRNLVGPIAMRQPAKIGHFSIDKGGPNSPDERIFYDDDRNLKIINWPKSAEVEFDLRVGYKKIADGGRLHCLPPNTGLVDVFKWILRHRDRFQLHEQVANTTPSLHTDFIAYRGCLQRIMCLPYEDSEDLLIYAQKFQETTYFNMTSSDEKIKRETTRDDRTNLLSYAGLKFEDYITKPLGPPRGDEFQNDRHDELCCMVRTRLKKHSLVYGAEMDCTDRQGRVDDLKLSDFIEIKTTRTIFNDRQYENWCRKLVKWWSQSYLIGLSKLVCGYRDDDLIVRKLEKFNIHDFPEKGRQFWSDKVCLNFLNEFLNFVKQYVTEEDVAYKIYWRPGQNVTCAKMNTDEHKFVPDWFKQEMLKV